MMHTYLALGDSYTIGEQLPITDSFPYQLIQSLRKANPGRDFASAEIIAKTGWTTDELLSAVKDYQFQTQYDTVTLLIGVNNQYRGRDPETFRPEFRQLLDLAIRLAADNLDRVFVISIPDWGVTPFAADRDKVKVAADIDAFNLVCMHEAGKSGVHFIDITTAQRVNGHLPDFLAADGLHPSTKEYAQWSALISEVITQALNED